MGHFAFGWPRMELAAAAALSGALPLPGQAAVTNGGTYCVDPAVYASVLPLPGMAAPPAVAEAEAARKRQEEENAAIRLVHLLVTCAGAIQAGDYAAAAGNLADARAVLATISTATGIGRVTSHFAAALGQRLFPAFPHSGTPLPSAGQGELYRQFHEAGPYLKFAHFTANQAILEAFEGCNRVHVVDFALMRGLQWPSLIRALAIRPGGPPALRITGVGPPATGGRDELREVGIRLAELARSVNVPFSFRGVTGDQLDGLQPWMFQLIPGEAVAINSILQLHRLLVDPDAASTSLPAPIDIVLGWVASMQPKIFTVVEQEADHNKPALVERFTNALFYYAAVFDSMEAVSCRTGGLGAGTALAEAYLQREIFDIICGEGSGRGERHELLPRWRERLGRAGLTQVPLGPSAIRQATTLLRMFSGAGYCIQERGGCLTLAWHDRPLFSASAWRATTEPQNAAGAALTEARNDKNSGSESGGQAAAAAPGEIGMQ